MIIACIHTNLLVEAGIMKHSHQLACRSRNNEGSIHVNPQQPCPKKHCVEVMSFREEAIR